MKRNLFILIFLFFTISNLFSAHYIGYDMSIVAMGGHTYKFRFKCYRDISSGSQQLPFNQNFTIKRNGDNLDVQYITLTKIQQSNISYNPNDCPPFGANSSLELNVYESSAVNLSALNSLAGYYILSSVCCRQSVRNVDDFNAGMVFTMDFPRLNITSPYVNNSSPEFKKLPLTKFCVGKNYTLDLGAIDPNGDSLVFSFDRVISNTSKPFIYHNWSPGYGFNNILDGSPDITIDSSTGVFSFTPTIISSYMVIFKCEEYRNGIKIGEIRREVVFQTIICADEKPPITKVNDSTINSFVDTINIDEPYTINFKSYDHLSDSLQMRIAPNLKPGENIIDSNSYNAKWGEIGKATSTLGLIIDSVGTIESEFKWTPRCEYAREKPYTFTIITHDKNCPQPLYNSTFVELYVIKSENNKPYFILPDTVKKYSFKNYFIKEGDIFQLNGDSILKAYDYDSSQVITITHLPDSNNGFVNSLFEFNSFPDSVYATASFVWDSTCNTSRSEPYKVLFYAIDNDCLKPDTSILEINIYVLEGIKANQIQGSTQITDTSLIYTYTTLNQVGINYNWYGQNVKIISGQGTNSVNVKWSKVYGELTCEVINIMSFCTDTSNIKVNFTTGINNSNIESLKIYPNPTSDILILELTNSNQDQKISLYNVHGRLILEKYISDRTELDVSDLESGVYIIRTNDQTYKLLKL